jgi:hypothetical protein
MRGKKKEIVNVTGRSRIKKVGRAQRAREKVVLKRVCLFNPNMGIYQWTFKRGSGWYQTIWCRI